MRLAPRPTVALLLAAGLLLTACSSSPQADGAAPGAPRIVVTTTILGDLVARLVEDDAAVEVLMPPGADPHDFEPSAAQVAAMHQADLLVVNGLGLEERLLDPIDAARDAGVPVVEVAPQVDPVPFLSAGGDGHDHDHDHDHDHGSHDHDHGGHDHEGDDPHVWLDPVRMATAAEVLAVEVAEATGLDPAALEARAATYAAEARQAEVDARRLLERVPTEQRVLVTNHDALGYFARRFDLRLVGVVIPGGSTMAEPSAAEIAELAAAVRASGARAVFAEHTVSPRIAETLGREAGGVDVVALYTDSLGEPGTPAGTYAGMIVENARLVAEGLTGSAGTAAAPR